MELLKRLGLKAFNAVKSELIGIGIFVGVIWLAFFADAFLPLDQLALSPRRLTGLPGILAMPFLHGDFGHLLSNSVPLFILLALMAGSRANTWKVVGAIIVVSGLLLWIAGFPSTVYLGASMLVFGLIGFLVPAGFIEKRPVPIVISILVALMYGGTFIWGMLPMSKTTSELAHFYGAITGVALAFVFSRKPPEGTTLADSIPDIPGADLLK